MNLKRLKNLYILVIASICLFNTLHVQASSAGDPCNPSTGSFCGGGLQCCVKKGASPSAGGTCEETCDTRTEIGSSGGGSITTYDGAEERLIAAVLWDGDGRLMYQVFPNSETRIDDYKTAYCGVKSFPNYSGGTVSCGDEEDEKSYTLVWPGYELRSLPLSQRDVTMANGVMSTLTSSLNQAVDFVARYGKNIGENLTKADIAKALAEKAEAGGQLWGITISTATVATDDGQGDIYLDNNTGTFRQGMTASDYIVMEVPNKKIREIFIWRMPKGYGDGEYAVKTDENGPHPVNNDPITWQTIVAFADAAASNKDAAGFADSVDPERGFNAFYNPSELTKYLQDFSRDTVYEGMDVETLRLQYPEDIVLNRGNRKYSYYLGIMPYQWWNVANGLFWLFEMIAAIILFSAIMYTVYKQNYAIISPIERLQIQDYIANILIAIFFIGLYIPVFYVIAKTNSIFVDILNSFTKQNTLKMAQVMGSWTFKSLGMISYGTGIKMVSLFIIIRINISYISRAITITALHIVAPAVIASTAYTGRSRGTIFNTWLRELVAAIMMQTFDATIMTIYILITNGYTGLSDLESVFLVYTLIPMENFFKDKLTGTSGVAGLASEAFQNQQQAQEKGRQTRNNWVGAAATFAKNVIPALITGGSSLPVTMATSTLEAAGNAAKNNATPGGSGGTDSAGGGDAGLAGMPMVQEGEATAGESVKPNPNRGWRAAAMGATLLGGALDIYAAASGSDLHLNLSDTGRIINNAIDDRNKSSGKESYVPPVNNKKIENPERILKQDDNKTKYISDDYENEFKS